MATLGMRKPVRDASATGNADKALALAERSAGNPADYIMGNLKNSNSTSPKVGRTPPSPPQSRSDLPMKFQLSCPARQRKMFGIS